MKYGRRCNYSLLIFLLCMACNNAPNDVLSEKEMTKALVETHLLEARMTKYSITSVDTLNVLAMRLKVQTLKKIGTDTAAFNRSYKYYSSEPELFEKIYKNVIANLESQKKKTTKTNGSNKRP